MGNVHLQVSTISVKGMGEDGSAVYQSELKGWYVLAGGFRIWHVEIPDARCVQLRNLTVDIKTESENVSKSLDVTADSCRD
jgi:hypothetical protein